MAKKVNAPENEAERVEAERVEAEKAAAKEYFVTNRPLWGRSGNIIPANMPVTQIEMSSSLHELVKINYVTLMNEKEFKAFKAKKAKKQT